MFYQNSTNSPYGWVAGGLTSQGIPSPTGFDESVVSHQGMYYLYSANANALGLGQNEGVLIVLGPLGGSYNHSTFKVNIFFKYDGSVFKWRLYNWSSKAWTSWKDF